MTYLTRIQPTMIIHNKESEKKSPVYTSKTSIHCDKGHRMPNVKNDVKRTDRNIVRRTNFDKMPNAN